MTITEKILAAHAGKKRVSPGKLLNVRIDLALGNDITAPLAIKAFKEIGAKKVFHRDRVVLVPDHFTPAKDILSAEQCKILREFAKAQRLTHFFEIGECGIEHALLPEKGLVLPGEVAIGADSHTCTYGALGAFSTGVGSTDLAAAMATGKLWFKVPESFKLIYYGKINSWVSGKDLILFTIGDIGVDGALYQAMEFCGEAIQKLSMASRFTMANMAIEAGAKNGIIEPDETTLQFVKPRAKRPYRIYRSDREANYAEAREYNVSKIFPQVALPHIPSNVKDVREIGKIEIDQVIIGSCTNGHLDDLRVAAKILKGKKTAPSLRLIIIPATPEIYHQALREGLFEIFLSAGAVISPPTCGPCLGGHMGVLAEGEKALATTNRNFRGRMGHSQSEVYLSSPAVAAASAIKGWICHPDEIMKKGFKGSRVQGVK
ncbi:MAG: 3-isopropylmalate dehydratase large subunit [Deltaproteobacteria bacterium CG03_land_8_20_14_0_80_45_14]|nr:MAG: 3-isopropylmalate dehydratase large subunit [Deltaproteobacteria bacterium CG03_land_8_20_14_0_80_45_14]